MRKAGHNGFCPQSVNPIKCHVQITLVDNP
jgi:hypothetical protein